MKTTKKRQLAAIMFTDIVGYTALMQGDEATATAKRERHREVFEAQHSNHNGKIIQYYGDGTLSVFDSVIDATNCAIKMQRLFGGENPVPLRIGIHLGDIVYSKNEVYGDGVNVAARIESLGVAGAIMISSKVNDELKNHKDITSQSLGLYEFKNVDQPIEVFAISNPPIYVPQLSELNGKRKSDNKTIAVLPFVNMSTDDETEYFSDGITEEIINALAKIPSLRVISRTSSFYFKNKNVPLKEIAQTLKASAILEGSIRRSKNIVRITAQLIDTSNDIHFWSERWDRELDNIFEIQDEISLLIAEKFREQFGHIEIQDHLVTKQTDNLLAYEYSLKAKYHFNKWNPEDMRIAIPLYEKALELDPNHLESYAGLADAYGFMATTGFIPYMEAWAKAAELTNKALVLDDKNASAYYQLANVTFFTQSNYELAFSQGKKAIELNANFSEAHQFMSFLYIIAGDQKNARRHLDIALTINPLSQETLFFEAYFQYMIGEYDDALDQLDKCLAVNPKNLPAHSIKCYCLLRMGRTDKVINYFHELPDELVVPDDLLGYPALAYAINGDQTNINKSIAQLMEAASQPEGFRADSFLFLMYVLTGALDEAFNWVENAIEQKSSFLLFHYSDPLVRSMEADPRYKLYHQKIYKKAKTTKPVSVKKSLLEELAVAHYTERLLTHMDTAKPFMQSDLSLKSLADQIDIHPNQLSWLLNESIGKNFSEFVNHYRVEEFKRLATNPKNAHISLIGLAYDSGFNSKTVFNAYFKKETGKTPKQYLKGLA